MAHRLRFDPKRSLIAARGFTFAGRSYAPGDPFPHPDDAGTVHDRLRARQYEARAVNFAPEDATAEDPVQMVKAEKNGYYTITAPWFERPLTVRGKVNAEKALAEVREEGAPLGWIDGGSDVEVEELGGGWYQIDAPWLAEPEKVQGREAAEARQGEIHTAGAPEGWTLEDGRVAPETADDGTDPAAPASDGAEENAAKAESTEGAEQADATDEASDTASEGDGADSAAAGEQADTPAEGEAGKSEDPPATA